MWRAYKSIHYRSPKGVAGRQLTHVSKAWDYNGANRTYPVTDHGATLGLLR